MKQKNKKNQTNKTNILKYIIKTITILIISSILISIGYIFYTIQTIPEINANKLQTQTGTKITDNKGDTIWQADNILSEHINYDEIPELYKNSIIATEDKNFYNSNGTSLLGILNAGYSSIRSKIDSNYSARGGSTIDQQLIKNTYYNGGIGYNKIDRKIQELFLARQLNKHYSKDEILTFYVNKLEFSENTIGLKSAMKVYFNKQPNEFKKTPTDIAQIAYLVGLTQAPSNYNLYTNPEQGINRSKIILQIMKDNNIITNDEYDKAKQINLIATLRPRFEESKNINKNNLKYKSYAEGVLNELKQLNYNPNNASMTIKTFLDKTTFDKIEKEVKKDKYYQDDKIQIGLTMMKSDGVVLAMIGTRFNDENNRAMSRVRSSGSSLKPFTAYAPLFEYFGDKYNASSMISTANYVYPGTNKIMYNYGQINHGPKTLTDSLRLSLNTPVARIDDEILGSNRMKTFLHANNLDIKDTYSSVDGIGLNVSTLDSASAYNGMNNLGEYIYPRFIDEITFSDNSKTKIEKRTKISMKQSTAYTLLQMLRGVTLPNMTAKDAYLNKEGYAVKTGSVAFDDNIKPPAPYGLGGSDVWINSVTNQGISLSIWIGYDQPNTSPQVSDKFKGHQILTKKLQEMFGGNAPMWKQPQNVRLVGGSGINKMFMITDSHDITNNTEILKAFTLPIINMFEPKTIADKNWKSNNKYSKYYNKFSEKNIFDDIVLDSDIYNSIKDIQNN